MSAGRNNRTDAGWRHSKAMQLVVVLVALGALVACTARAPTAPIARVDDGTIAIGGLVTTTDGAAIPNAQVVLVGDTLGPRGVTDAAGRFEIRTSPGTWGVSAHAAGSVGAFTAPAPRTRDVRDIQLRLPARGGVTIAGTLRSLEPLADVYLEVTRISQDEGDVFAVPVARDGAFSATLPASTEYTLAVHGAVGEWRRLVPTNHRVEVALDVAVPAPPSAAVIDWVRTHAAKLKSVEPGSGLDDLAPIGALVGDAAIVGLGEATHGTREFSLVKHRIVEYLVAERGFTTFAFETGAAEALDAYVMHGKGVPTKEGRRTGGETSDARAALDKTPYAVWKTEEILALVEWLRTWNATHDRKVRFVGYDVEFSVDNYRQVAAYLERVAPTERIALLAPLAHFAGKTWPEPEIAMPRRDATLAALDAIAALFDARRDDWIARTKRFDYVAARRALQLLRQGADYDTIDPDGEAAFAVRDRAMADNIAWLHEHVPGRMIVWAHNQHVANTYVWKGNMGGHLRARFGTAYRNVGLFFGHGTFHAMRPGKGFEAIELPPPPDTLAATPLARAASIAFLDLRNLPAGPVRDWFARPRMVRDTGFVFWSEALMTRANTWTESYDAILYVERSTPTRFLSK